MGLVRVRLPTATHAVLVALTSSLTLAGCNEARDKQTLISLREEYLNPAFSDVFLDFWQIEDLDRYRHRLVQEYFLAESRAEGLAAAAGSAEEMVRFSRLLMINWLEQELILRSLMLVEAMRAGDARGRPAVGKDPLDEELLRNELGQETRIYAQYQEWVAQARAGRRL